MRDGGSLRGQRAEGMGTGREVDAFEMQVIVKALTSVFIIESDHSQRGPHEN